MNLSINQATTVLLPPSSATFEGIDMIYAVIFVIMNEMSATDVRKRKFAIFTWW